MRPKIRNCNSCNSITVNWDDFEKWAEDWASEHEVSPSKIWEEAQNLSKDLCCIQCEAIRVPRQFYPKDIASSEIRFLTEMKG